MVWEPPPATPEHIPRSLGVLHWPDAFAPPASDDSIGLDCEGMPPPRRDAGGCPEVARYVSLTKLVASPGSHKAVSLRALFHRNNPRRRKKRSNKP